MNYIEGVYIKTVDGIPRPTAEADCRRACEELDKGNKIALTVNGCIVSYVTEQDGKWYEKSILEINAS